MFGLGIRALRRGYGKGHTAADFRADCWYKVPYPTSGNMRAVKEALIGPIKFRGRLRKCLIGSGASLRKRTRVPGLAAIIWRRYDWR